jgi:hypothetical protein
VATRIGKVTVNLFMICTREGILYPDPDTRYRTPGLSETIKEGAKRFRVTSLSPISIGTGSNKEKFMWLHMYFKVKSITQD